MDTTPPKVLGQLSDSPEPEDEQEIVVRPWDDDPDDEEQFITLPLVDFGELGGD